MKKSTNMNAVPGGQPQIDFSQTSSIVCENSECNNDTFMNVMKFRRIPKLVAGTAKDQVIPIQVFLCTACGGLNKEFDLNV
jgi:hypothetical protein